MGGVFSNVDTSSIVEKSIKNVSSTLKQEGEVINTNVQTNVIQNVDGGSFSSDTTQEISGSSEINIKDLESDATQEKLSSAIAQQTKNSLSGVTVGQIATNVSKINQIIEDINKVVRNGIQYCKVKNYNTSENTVKDVKNVDINLNTVQKISTVTKCILDNDSNSKAVSEIDSNVKHITSQSIAGVNITTLAMVALGGLVVFGVGIVGGGELMINSIITSLMGPILFLTGAALMTWRFINLKKSTETSILYPLNYLDYYGYKFIAGPLDFDENKNVTEYGIADIYEVTSKNKSTKEIRLYKKGDEREIKPEIKLEDIDVKIIPGDEANITFSVKNSTKYGNVKLALPSKIISSNSTNNPKIVYLTPEIEAKMGELGGKDDNYLYWKFIPKTFHIELYYNNKDPIAKFEQFPRFYFLPTLVTRIKELNIKTFILDPIFIVGLSMSIAGLIFILIKMVSGKKSDSHDNYKREKWGEDIIES
jgi:hypothetical protein